MSGFRDAMARAAKASPFEVLPRLRWAGQTPTYREASPALIRSALRRSQSRPSGNWYVLCASTALTRKPYGRNVGGQELVAWRDADGAVHVGPAACPHLGADLSTGILDCGTLVCPWHGLRLAGGRQNGWNPLPAHDDGVLVWVRLDRIGGEEPTDAPIIPERPATPHLSAVADLVGVCEPSDVIANRLDPWHGSWFHPYSFTRLEVISSPPVDGDITEESDRFLVAVTFRLGRLGVPVIAEFTSPEPRTIVMRIVDGEGTGSVVETHATPLAPTPDGRPRTAVIEAVVAHSDRPNFGYASKVETLVRPMMRHAAARLWRDDLVYAERLYALRSNGSQPG